MQISILNITALAMAGFANAACNLANMLDQTMSQPTNYSQLCQPTGAETWTFAMEVSDVVVPSFSAEAPWAGYSGGQGFYIFDNTCVMKAVYDPQQDSNCGSPYVIQENFSTQVLTVTNVWFASGAADAYFSFDYGDGKYSIGNNQCVCNDMSEVGGLQAGAGCRCAFPLDGTFDAKRAVTFEA